MPDGLATDRGALEASDDDEEEDAVFNGFNTAKQLAEFKARALGELTLADRIRANQISEKDLMAYLKKEIPQGAQRHHQGASVDNLVPPEVMGTSPGAPNERDYETDGLSKHDSALVIPGVSRYNNNQLDESALDSNMGEPWKVTSRTDVFKGEHPVSDSTY